MGQKIYALLALALSASLCFPDSPRKLPTSYNTSTYGGAGGTDCGGGGCDYTDLNTWESATDNDLVTATDGEVLECYDDAASFDDATNLSGATTSSDYFRVIKPASGEGHDGTSNNGFFIDCTADVNVLTISEDNSAMYDLIVQLSANSSTNRNTVKIDNGVLVGMIVFDTDNAGSGKARGMALSSDGGVAVHCLAEAGENQGYLCAPGAGNTVYLYNCGAIENGSYGINEFNGTVVAINCLSDANSSSEFSGTFTGSFNNASSDGSAPGTDSRTNQTFTYVNSSGNDYHLAEADAGADNFGKDLSGDSVYPFSTDIDEEDFDTWDIGFDENDPPEPPSPGVGPKRRRIIFGHNFMFDRVIACPAK